MSKRVRLGMEALEAREVPAAFSFRLADGTVGSGQFTTPGGVDAAQATQSIGVADLTVSLGGEAYAVQTGATASYAYGVLTGVTATATGPGGPGGGDDSGPPIGGDDISLSGATATVGTASATVAFDAADTQADFTLGDGVSGTLSYDLPWDSVDATQASQSVSLSNFVLNIAGQNLTPATATFTTSPTAQFANGVFTGLTFAIDTSALANFPYAGLSSAGMTVTADLIGLPDLTANILLADNFITMDFAQVTTGKAYLLKVDVGAGGQQSSSFTISVGAGASAEEIRTMVLNGLKSDGFDVTSVGTTKLSIGGKGGKFLLGAEFKSGSLNAQGQFVIDNTLTGPKLTSQIGGVNVFVNGVQQQPG